MFVCDGLVVYLCTVDGTIEFAPKAIQKIAASSQSLLIGIKVVLQIRRQTALPCLLFC